MSIAKKAVNRFVVPLEEDEMLCRFIEASEGLRRPAGVSAQSAIKQLCGSPEELLRIRKGLRAVMSYWREQIADIQATN